MVMSIMRFVSMRSDVADTIGEFSHPGIPRDLPVPNLPRHDGATKTNIPSPSATAGDDLMAALLWSTLEVTTAFVVACIPATRLFVQHFFPVIKSGASRALSSSGGGGGGGGHAFSMSLDTMPSGNFTSRGDTGPGGNDEGPGAAKQRVAVKDCL